MDAHAFSSSWHLLPHFILRGTGLSFEWLEALAMPGTVQAIERWLNAQDELDAARSELKRAARMPVEGRPLPESDELSRHWNDALQRREQALAVGRRRFDDEFARARAQFHRLAMTETFREAIFLSSPDVYHNNLCSYLADEPGQRPRTSKVKRVERRLVAYLQRFCAKNETASFFGPVGYGGTDPQLTSGLVLRTESHRPAARETFIAFWAVNALAELISQDANVRADLPPRRNPLCESRDDGTIRLPGVNRSIRLSAIQRTVFDLADGERTPAEIAAAVHESRDVVQTLIENLARARLLLVEFDVPTKTFHPLHDLCDQVARLPQSCSSREHWLRVLRELEDLRSQFAAAPLDARSRLLAQAETWFTQVTGQPARRGEGQLYADRFLFYEECLRDASLTLSPRWSAELVRRLAPALELSMALGTEVWRGYQRLGAHVFEREAAAGTGLAYADFVHAFRDLDPHDAPRESEWMAAFREQFQRILEEQAQRSPHAVTLSAADLPRVDDAVFPHRYALLDVMLAARNAEALARGEYLAVLSRLHHHLLVWSWLFCFHPDRASLERDLRIELAAPAYAPLAALEVTRRNKAFYDFPGPVVEYQMHSTSSKHDTISVSDLVVVEDRGRLCLRRRSDGQLVELYLPLADLTTYAPAAIFARPPLVQIPLPRGGHSPRIQIEDAVVLRERWALDAAALAPHSQAAGFERMVELWRVKRHWGLPRFAFARVPSERKPFLVDFHSALSLELLDHFCAHDPYVEFTEMLPGPDELWLTDPDGHHCCELRMNVFRDGPGTE